MLINTDQPIADGPQGDFGSVTRTHFPVYTSYVIFDSMLTNEESLGDLFIGKALGDQL